MKSFWGGGGMWKVACGNRFMNLSLYRTTLVMVGDGSSDVVE